MSFTVYRSSAGSGKTYTLVKEYLGIVLQDPFLFRNILAITFTNKAANEMRERILSSLRDIANPQENPDSSVVRNMLPDLVGITGLAPEEVSRQATVVLGNILHNYQDFSVGTIDSFIHRIIRTFAFDLHLPLNFEVEMDEQAMVGMAVDLLLGRVGIDKVPTDILKKFTESRIDDEKNWDVEKDLKSFAAKLLRDDIAQFLPVLEKMETSDIIAASEELLKYMKWFETEGQRQASSIIDIWQENDIAPEDLSYGKNGIYGYVRRLANGDFSKLTANNYVVATLGEDKWTSTKADGAKVAVINSIKTVLLQKATDLVNHVDNGKRRYIFYRLLKKNIFPLAVLHEIIAVMQQIREAEGIIHISEFDKRIAGVVGSEPVPFIYERLGDRYSHFLIDEFQDTSVLEWQNLLPLIENSLAEGKFNMVVGDAKQAIYRFKGGEVEQLVKLPEIYKKALTSEMIARERQLHDHYDDRKLQSNYRSRENVIGFNNAFYTFISTLLSGMLKDIYADCFQQSSGNSPGGEVRIHFIDQEGRKEDKEPVYFEQIRNYIGEMVQEHGYALRDIAILTRSNSSASKIARNLLLNGTNVISAESLLLSSSPEVNFLINCLDFITNSDNKLALANMLSFIVQRDGRELHPSMAELLSGKDKDTESLHRLQSYFIKAGIHFNREELSQMGLYERVEGLIRIFSLDNTLDPYLMFFLDAVYDYSMNKRFIDEDFTSYWRENSNKFSIVVPEGLDAVNVMTIHKAKGLEFPVVIYPFANSKVDISRDKKWITIDDPRLPGLKAALIPLINDLSDTDYADYLDAEKEKALLDLLNIVYVATTRPTDCLFVICDRSMAKSEWSANIPTFFRTYLEHAGMWDEEKNTYFIGEPGRRKLPENTDDKTLEPSRFISSDWREHILLSGKAAEHWDLSDDSRNLVWGNLIHNILSSVMTEGDVQGVIQEELLKGNIGEEDVSKIKSVIEGIMQLEVIKPFFDGSFEIRNESTIMTNTGREYRPDRIMVKDGSAIVLDYKTGKEDPGHKRQVEQYGSLLSEMGYKEVIKYLLYIDDPCRLVRV